MVALRKVNENEDVERIALIMDDEEILIINDKNEVVGKVLSKQISKKALEEKTLRFRVIEALNTRISNDEKLPSLRELFFNPHLLMYGKDSHEVKGLGYNCPICGLEIDEYGYCGCGSGSA
ncbi:MAG: sulfolobus mercury resistance protein, MerI [Sulfolobaceae archaeon]